MKLAGMKHKLSMAYHPEKDRSSERTNKTILQCLQFHVERNQKGWAKALPKAHFDIINTMNVSTQISPFVLKTGRSPWVLLPLTGVECIMEDSELEEATQARGLVESINEDVEAAKDCLLAAEISQVHHANKDRRVDPGFTVGDQVMLEMAHQRREYMQKKSGRVAKFMPCWDGPYEVVKAFPESSTYKLRLLGSSTTCLTYHISHLKCHVENDNNLFPDRKLEQPGPIITPEGLTEYFVDQILDERPYGRGKQYLVRWQGYGPGADLWLLRSEMLQTEALDAWEARTG